MILLVNGATKTMRRLLPQENLGVLITPKAGNKAHWWPSTTHWAIDNGAWSGFEARPYRKLLRRCPATPSCLFVAAPDCVGDAIQTRALFNEWYEEIASMGFPIAYVLQDGQRSQDVPWNECQAVFVGGSTAYKLGRDAVRLIREAKERGKWVHMGRVNTMRRVRFAITAGVDSIDGSQFSWFSDTYIPKFLAMLSCQQGELPICTH
jgi:hypothetical protein